MGGPTRKALVTGATRGLGRQAALELARLGMLAIVSGRRIDQAREVADDLRLRRFEAFPVQLDVTDPYSVAHAVNRIRERFGELHVLINNAGVMLPGKDGSSLAGLHQTLATNLVGAYNVLDSFAPLLAEGARVVNVSSRLGQLSRMHRGNEAYRISKAALNAVTRIFADRLQDKRVLVNSVCPGWVRTDLGGPGAVKTLEEGVDTIVWAATLPDGSPTGAFFAERQEIPW